MRPRTRLARAAVWGALGLVAVTLLYLVGMNAFLSTRLFRDAITSEEGSLRVEYARAHSLWPGRIHVEGLAIRGRDGSVEWVLSIDRCDFHVSLLDLVRRRFHASHVRGTGLSMRLRQRLQKVTLAADAVPPVPGFLDPPLAEVGPPSPPLTDAEYKLWSVQLDDVVAEHVRELWIDSVRAAGDLRIEGRWFFRPLRWLDVGPAAIDLRSVNVFYGADDPMGLDVHGTLVATIHPMNLKDVEGSAILDGTALDADVHGALLANSVMKNVDAEGGGKTWSAAWSIEPAAAHLVADHTPATIVVDVSDVELVSREPIRKFLPMPDGIDLDLKRASANVHAALELRTGALQTHVGIEARNLKIRTGDATMTGTLGAELEGKAQNSVVDISGTAAFTSGAVADVASDAPGTGPGWWVRVRVADARLSPTSGGGTQLRAAVTATAKDAAPLSAFLAKTTPLPRWLIDTVPTEHLRIAAEIRARPSALEVRSVQIRSDKSKVDFEFEKLENWKEWALLLDAGPVLAGVRAGDGGTEVVLANAQAWFKDQVAAFRTNASRLR